MKTIALAPYKTLHLWLCLPLFIMQAGIFVDYWPGFTEKAWGIHVHFWTGTLWFSLVITQAWLATRRRLKEHRTWGMIGLFIGGGAVFSALSLNARHATRAIEFDNAFLYGVVVMESVMITAFMLAIILAILKRKNYQEHLWWLSASMFYILFPAVDRGVGRLLGQVFGLRVFPGYFTVLLIVSSLILVAWKFKKLRHPATLLGIGVNLIGIFLFQIGSIPAVQYFVAAVFKP